MEYTVTARASYTVWKKEVFTFNNLADAEYMVSELYAAGYVKVDITTDGPMDEAELHYGSNT